MFAEKICARTEMEELEIERKPSLDPRKVGSKVVEKVGNHGIEATHDYAKKSNAIPLPATFLTELGESLSKKKRGMQVRHYSEYPFRTRKNGGPKDEFAREALRHLKLHPGEAYVEFVDDFEGRSAL